MCAFRQVVPFQLTFRSLDTLRNVGGKESSRVKLMSEPASRSRFLRASGLFLRATVFFQYLSISSPFFIMTVFGSSLESTWRWKSEKILNNFSIAWKVLYTLFTYWCAHLQPERIYRCRSISVGSSNFFQHLRIFGTLDRWFGWSNGLLEISILRPSHRTAPGKTRNSTISRPPSINIQSAFVSK